jgi:cell division protein FtsL
MINDNYVLVSEVNKNFMAVNDAMIYLSVCIIVLAVAVGFLFMELKKLKIIVNKNKNG